VRAQRFGREQQPPAGLAQRDVRDLGGEQRGLGARARRQEGVRVRVRGDLRGARRGRRRVAGRRGEERGEQRRPERERARRLDRNAQYVRAALRKIYCRGRPRPIAAQLGKLISGVVISFDKCTLGSQQFSEEQRSEARRVVVD